MPGNPSCTVYKPHIHTYAMSCAKLQGMEVTMSYSVQLMEASTPPNLFESGELCQLLIRAAASEYMCRDELYGRCLGIQVSNHHSYTWTHTCTVIMYLRAYDYLRV